jgi:hypothetical protein
MNMRSSAIMCRIAGDSLESKVLNWIIFWCVLFLFSKMAIRYPIQPQSKFPRSATTRVAWSRIPLHFQVCTNLTLIKVLPY